MIVFLLFLFFAGRWRGGGLKGAAQEEGDYRAAGVLKHTTVRPADCNLTFTLPLAVDGRMGGFLMYLRVFPGCYKSNFIGQCSVFVYICIEVI